MAETDAVEDQEQSVPPISDTNLDDTGELDYEPSEPSANSIKDAVSDDEEEGEAGDSDHEQKLDVESSVVAKRPQQGSRARRSIDDEGITSGPENKSGSDGADNEFSGPEEGEVDELEEGEVKDESDDGSESGDRGRSKGDEKETSSRQQQQRSDLGNKPQENRNTRSLEPKAQRGEELQRQQQRRVPIAAPSPSSAVDAKPSSDSRPPEDAGICKFYVRGQCTWGSFCKFVHPTGGDRQRSPSEADLPRRPPDPPSVASSIAPVPLMALKADPPPPPQSMSAIPTRPASPPSESAWERGLKQARERIRRATEKKEVDPDFERKRLTMPLGPNVGAADEISAAVTDQRSPGLRLAPRPLMEFGCAGDRLADEGHVSRPPPPPSASIETIPRQQYVGREPFYGEFGNGDRPAYERRRQQPAQTVSVDRGNREYMENPHPRSQHITTPPASRRPEPQDRYYGTERREHGLGNAAPALPRERQQFGRDDYQVADVGLHRSSQEVLSPQSSSVPYYHRHSTSSSVDYSDQQQDSRRIGGRPAGEFRTGDKDERRRPEPEPQGWEYRSPPAYSYRDRGPDYRGAQENVGRRNYDNERQFRGDIDNRRPPTQHHQAQPRVTDQVGPSDGRSSQQQYRPPNYHYYRTLQQQQQNRNRNRASDQERKPGSDYSKDRDREKLPTKGRNEYNYHYYSDRDRQNQQQQQAGGRPLPYERPSFTRQEHRGEWRDPWRRSTSPGGRRGTTVGSEHRHSGQGNRISRDDDRSGTNSPGGPGGFEKRRRRTSGSSSISGSSGSSRSRSSGNSIGGKDAALRERSIGSSRSSGGSPRRRDQLGRSSGSPIDGTRYDRYKSSSKDRSPLRTARKETGDVASRAAAKALGSHPERSASPFDDDSPRAYRRPGSGNLGGRHSSAGSRNSGQALTHEHRGQVSSPPVDQSPESAGRITQTRPLSPPPPAPFLATAAVRVSGRDGKSKHASLAQQRTEQLRKPIKMTIANKSKVRTNIYENSPEEGDFSAAPASDTTEDISSKQIPLSPVGSPTASLDEPAPKKMKTSADSGSGSGGESRVMSRREELLRQLRAVEHAIDAKRKKDKGKP